MIAATPIKANDKHNPSHLPPPQGQWTYDDYLRFVPDEPSYRYEIIEGIVYMNAAPLPIHQKIVVNLTFLIRLLMHSGQLEGEVYVSPIDVVLANVATPVQPDLLFIRAANLSIVKESNIEGIPDLIVEVLSSNWQHDRKTKFEAYLKAGVPEYWIVDPQNQLVDVFVKRGQAYVQLGRFSADTVVRSEQLSTFAVPAADFFR